MLEPEGGRWWGWYFVFVGGLLASVAAVVANDGDPSAFTWGFVGAGLFGFWRATRS